MSAIGVDAKENGPFIGVDAEENGPVKTGVHVTTEVPTWRGRNSRRCGGFLFDLAPQDHGGPKRVVISSAQAERIRAEAARFRCE